METKLSNLFIQGCENSDAQYDFTKKQRIRLGLYLIAICLIAPKRTIDQGKIYFIFGPLHDKILNYPKNTFYHGNGIGKITNIFCKNTIVSLISRRKRIKIALNALKDNKDCCASGGRARLVEFSFFNSLFEELSAMQQDPKREIVTASLTDRYVTWIAGLCKRTAFHLCIYQHGTLLHFIGLKHRIEANDFYVYNEEERKSIVSKVICNDSCTFHFFKFDTKVRFSLVEKNQTKKYIGIVSQGDENFNLEAIKTVTHALPNSKLFLMLHPREPLKQSYKCLMERIPTLAIESEAKYGNLDIVITKNSTMIYDYCAAGYSPLFILINPGAQYEFLDCEIRYCSSFKELEEELRR